MAAAGGLHQIDRMTQQPRIRYLELLLSRLAEPLASQLRFLLEADRLKSVARGSRLADGSRRENTAEHSWHISLFSLVLASHAAAPVDPLRVISMLLIHDLVEIDCGDTPLFDEVGAATQAAREAVAAHRLFGVASDGAGGRVPCAVDRVRGRGDSGCAVCQGGRPPATHSAEPRGRRWHLDRL